jgi:hypothetical protein
MKNTRAMKEIAIPEIHVIQAIEVMGEAVAKATGRHPEWVKRRMREAQKYLSDPANDSDTPLRREYHELMAPVMTMALETSGHDTDEYFH